MYPGACVLQSEQEFNSDKAGWGEIYKEPLDVLHLHLEVHLNMVLASTGKVELP